MEDYHAECKAKKLKPDQTRALLNRFYPGCFKPKGKLKVPLAIGISKQIKLRMPQLSNSEIKEALSNYVNGPKYLGQCVEGAPRYNLDGLIDGAVSQSDAAWAKQRLEYLEALWAAKRQIRDQRRNARKEARHDR